MTPHYSAQPHFILYTITGGVLVPPVKRSTERQFLNGLNNAFKRLTDRLKNGNGLISSIQQEVRMFMRSPEVDKYLRKTIENMVKSERVASARSWREAAAKGTHGPLLYKLISQEMQGLVGKRVREIIAESVKYIKSVPKEWAEYITKYVYEETLKGRRAEEIEAGLAKMMPERVQGKLKMIARTEAAKANAAIVQARAEMCGIRAYIWRSVTDERTRDSHAMMDGILVFYDDPPSPEALFPRKGTKPYGKYHAGNTFNCRCYQEPVVDERFLPDVIRFHDHGKIRTMSKNAFLRKYKIAA